MQARGFGEVPDGFNLFKVNATTGAVVWRRLIGEPTPFGSGKSTELFLRDGRLWFLDRRDAALTAWTTGDWRPSR